MRGLNLAPSSGPDSNLVEVEIDGQRLDHVADNSVFSLRVEQRVNRPARAVVEMCGSTMSGFDADHLDRYLNALVDAEAALSCHFQDSEADSPLFSGHVVGLETARPGDGQTVWRLRAEDRLNRLRRDLRSERYENLTGPKLLATITDRHGLHLDWDHLTIDDDRPYRVFHQANETDLALLDRVLNDMGAVAFLTDDTLKVRSASADDDTIAQVVADREVISMATDRRPNRGSVPQASGWDYVAVEPVGSDDDSQRALGHVSADHGPASRQRWTRWAAVDEVSVRAEVTGRSGLVPGAGVRIGNNRPFLIGRANHVLGPEGYRTGLSSLRAPAPTAENPGPVITIGIVSTVEDPEQKGRIRVNLPSYGNLESDWLPVAMPGLSANGGLQAIPDVGATVVIALALGHTHAGLVLGGLAQPDQMSRAITDERSRRFDLGAYGALVSVDGGGQRVLVENGDGSRLELGPEKVVLHSARDLDIEAPGQTIRIMANRVDFERRS